MKWGSKIIVEVDPFWRRTPLTSSHILRLWTSSISSGVTSHGPAGLKVSADLPFDHCPPRSFADIVDDHVTGDSAMGIVDRAKIAGPLADHDAQLYLQSSFVEPRGMRNASSKSPTTSETSR
jgi:hypothetical protein